VAAKLADLLQRFAALRGKAHEILTGTDPAAVARRAAVIALVIRLGNAGLAYVAQVVLARLMGQYEYGIFAYVWVWFLVFTSVSTLGFGDSPLRYLTEMYERGESRHLRGFLRVASLVTILTSIATAVAVTILLPFGDKLIGQAYVIPLVLMGVALPFACLQSFLEAVGRSFGWTIPALLPIYILRHAFLLAFMTGAVALGFEATATTALVCLVLTLIVSLAYQTFAILRRLSRILEPGPRAYRTGEWLRGSVPFAILYGAANLSSFAEVLILSFFVSPLEIAIYFGATRIIQIMNLVPYAATVGAAHLFASYHARDDRVGLQRLCRQVALLTFALTMVLAIAVFLVGHWLLATFGDGFQAGYLVLLILTVGVVARTTAGPSEDILNMTGHTNLSAGSYMAVVVVNMALALLLVVPFGTIGAAVASCCGMVGRAYWLAFAVRRRLGIDTPVVPLPKLRFAWPAFLLGGFVSLASEER